MMFSATMPKEVRVVAKMFLQNAFEVFIDDESKLTLHGLKQYFIKLKEDQKNRKLADLLDVLQFNQVIIFLNKRERAKALNKILKSQGFPTVSIYGKMDQAER
jgi:ATP-dependent RNA helicase UAP56/SUB2